MLLLLLLTAMSFAVDLSGTWSWDRDASDDLGPLLEARGVPWHLRVAMASLDRRLVLVQDEGTLRTALHTAVQDQQQLLLLDGVPREQTTPKGDVVTVTHEVVGEEVRTTVRLTLADGSPATLLTRRSLGEDGSLRLQTTLSAEDGRRWSATEVYRRIEEAP